MLVLYTTETILRTIYSSTEYELNIWYDFIKKIRPAIKILLDEDSDFEYNDENPVFVLNTAFDLYVEWEYHGDEEANEITQIQSLQQSSIKNPCSVILLDIPPEQAKIISDNYGVVCHSFKDLASMSPLFQEGVEKCIQKDERTQGWKKIISPTNILPSNSLIFIDRYLFSSDRHGSITSQDGLDNIFEILDNILPEKLGVDYHVLFLFDATELDTGETFERISTRINTLKRRLKRPYNIIIETLSIDKADLDNFEETHNRRILSNYFIIRVDRSLKVYKPDDTGIYSQSLWLDWIGSKGILVQKQSDTPAKALYKYLEEIKRVITQKQQAEGKVYFSQNGKYKISINQLIHRLI